MEAGRLERILRDAEAARAGHGLGPEGMREWLGGYARLPGRLALFGDGKARFGLGGVPGGGQALFQFVILFEAAWAETQDGRSHFAGLPLPADLAARYAAARRSGRA